MKRWSILLLLVLLFFLVGTSFLYAKVYIDVYASGIKKFPIAVPPLKNLGKGEDKERIGQRFAIILSQDLGLSGLFKIIDPAAFLVEPTKIGLTREEINWSAWSTIGAEALVSGGFTLEKENLTLEIRLFDVFQGQSITGRRYEGSLENLPQIAHRFANEIIKSLTGEEGIFESKIAYVSTSSKHKEIYLMDLAGYNKQKITNHQSIILSPAFSPEGKEIAFTSYRDGNPDLFIKDILTGKERKFSIYPGAHISPAFSPEGKKIALALSVDGNPEIYLINQEGKILNRLTDNWANDVSPSWSPEGKEIAFVSNRSGNPHIYIVDTTGKNVRRLTFEGKYNASPAWSPRGDKIAFAGRGENGFFDLYTINPDGSNLQRLTANAGDNEKPSWSANGLYLIFSSTREGKPGIYLMKADGSETKRLSSPEENATQPAWSFPSK